MKTKEFLSEYCENLKKCFPNISQYPFMCTRYNFFANVINNNMTEMEIRDEIKKVEQMPISIYRSAILSAIDFCLD